MRPVRPSAPGSSSPPDAGLVSRRRSPQTSKRTPAGLRVSLRSSSLSSTGASNEAHHEFHDGCGDLIFRGTCKCCLRRRFAALLGIALTPGCPWVRADSCGFRPRAICSWPKLIWRTTTLATEGRRSVRAALIAPWCPVAWHRRRSLGVNVGVAEVGRWRFAAGTRRNCCEHFVGAR